VKNTVHINVEFSFKGETFRPAAVIDLDLLINGSELPDLHNALALEAGIDTYSYAFEVMQQSPILFSNATGLASGCINEGCFDLPLFVEKRGEAKRLKQLQQIASEQLGIDDLAAKPEIREALIKAYQLGQTSGQKILAGNKNED
jgi:hypothetical protein